ncbi:hypothetical protein ACFXP7_13415 [Microbacterium sp. P06]|uniref:hypothetical protein n=1 Tax=unclassified Microbacterium TaxID=2609290 RepID=UPI0037471F8C
MAKVGGRSAWIAWPAMLFCAAVVGVLVWLALPGVPGAITFVGETLRSATTDASASAPDEPADPATDCRSLYPDRLWAEMTWTPEVLLSQNAAPPASTTTLAQALAPTVRFTCTWTTEDGRIASTTLADVRGGSEAVAQAALVAEGFSCDTRDERVHCERSAGDVTELHDLRGTAWLSTVLTRWMPEDYGSQTAERAFAD